MTQRQPAQSKLITRLFALSSVMAITAGCGTSSTTTDDKPSVANSEQTSSDEGAETSQPSIDSVTDSHTTSNKPNGNTPAAAPETKQLGPHGGVLTPWEEQSIEFEVLIDRTEQSISIYSRTADKKRAAVLATPQLTVEIPVPQMRIQLRQVRQAGEPPDKSSLFKGTDAKLATSQQLSGTITGQIEKAELKLKFHELPSHSGDF